MSKNNGGEWLKATTSGRVIGVDREANILRGYVVAQEGPFKDGRGDFNKSALKEIVRLMKQAPNGLKSKFAHPTETDDGLGKFLGRAKNPRMEQIEGPRDSEGTRKDEPVWAVRADLHFDKTALDTPPGGGGKPYGVYVMDLAESDPNAFSSSLQLQTEKEYRIDKDGRPAKDADGRDLPPLWFPTALHASDIVDTGDAVDGILSATEAEGLDVTLAHKGVSLLDRQFKGASREEVRKRCLGFLDRYLVHRFGEEKKMEVDEQRITRLLVSPEFVADLLSLDTLRTPDGQLITLTKPLPSDVQVVGVKTNAIPAESEAGTIELLLSSEQFDVVAPGGEVPILAGPQFGMTPIEKPPKQLSAGDPDLLRRKMKWRDRRCTLRIQK